MIGMSNLKGKEEAPVETAIVLMPDIERKDTMISFLGKKEKTDGSDTQIPFPA